MIFFLLRLLRWVFFNIIYSKCFVLVSINLYACFKGKHLGLTNDEEDYL